MKKVSIVLSMLLLTAGSVAVAQTGYTMTDVLVSSVKLNDGKNTVRLADNKGIVAFTKRGDQFFDVVFTDASGKPTRLVQKPSGTGNLPKPTCQYPLPDACFGIPNSSEIGMCICKPTDLSSGEDYNISLLLPAVQKVREAAARRN